MPPTSGKWRTAKEIVQIYVDPCKVAGQLFRISSISVLGAPTVSFDKNTTDTVTNMPTARKISMGGKLTVSETPVREGYAFAGWSKSPTDRSNVKTTFGIRRKTLRNSVGSMVGKDSPILTDPIMTQRPEQLSVEQFVALTNLIATVL